MPRRPSGGIILAGAAIAALVLWSRNSSAAIDATTGLEEADTAADPSIPLATIPDFTIDTTPPTEDAMTTFADADPAARLPAFAYLVRSCENTAASVADGTCYTTFFGGAQFSDLSTHPVLTGEMSGVPLDFLGPKYAGKVSTAAGAYQINVPTWSDVSAAGAWGPALTDFSPASQDEAMRRVLVLCGAWQFIQAGDLAGAIARASTRWASLPGSTAGQGGRSMAFAEARINEALA